MPQHTRNYHYFSCSAKVDNLLQPICTAITAGGFEDAETILEDALAAGWSRTTNGKDVLCPVHAKESVEPAAVRRKARGVQASDVAPEAIP